MKSDLICVLDIGSHEIKAVCAEFFPVEGIKNIILETSPSNGIEKGSVVNFNFFVDSLEEAIVKIEEKIGRNICKVNICVGADHIKSYYSEGMITISETGSEIKSQDIDRAVESAKLLSVPMDRKILHTCKLGFEVDGQGSITNPAGMFGTRMKAKLYIITALESKMHNIFKAVSNTGMQIDNIMFSGFMDIFSVFSKEQQEKGGLLMNIGSHLTYLVAFKENEYLKVKVYPWGGEFLTNVIKREFNIPFKSAQNRKEEIISVFPRIEPAVNSHIQDIKLLDIAGKQLDDFFTNTIKSDLNREELDLASESFIITGGTALMGGLAELAEEALGIKTMTARPKLVNFNKESCFTQNGIKFSSALGSLNYYLYEKSKLNGKSQNRIYGAINKVKVFLNEYF